MTEWINEKLSGNRLKRGITSGHVLKSDIETLVREVVQNSRDAARNHGSEPVRVVFTLCEFSGDRKKELLEAMDWKNLDPHLEACGSTNTESAARLVSGRQRMNGDDPVFCLKIEDFGTTGLKGGEFEDEGNFALLCRSEFITSQKTGRGGSFGIGKSVMWSFSEIATVMMSSYLYGEEKRGLRIFGRTELPSRTVKGVEYVNGSMFGERKKTGDGDCAFSIFDNPDLSEQLNLDRNPADGSGSSFMIVNFFEYLDSRREALNISEEIKDAAEKWFWPSISENKLEVEILTEKNNLRISHEKADPLKKWVYFSRAAGSEANCRKTEKPLDLARKNIFLKIPAERNSVHPDFNAELELSVIRLPETAERRVPLNSVAVYRGFGMVVKYLQLRAPSDGVGFNAVIKGGTAVGSSRKNEWAEEFLRSSEPPAHNSWEGRYSRYGYKKGSAGNLKKFWDSVSDEVFELIDEQVHLNSGLPNGFSRLFPIGGGLKEARKASVRIELESVVYKRPLWEISGRIFRSSQMKTGWEAKLGFSTSTDSGNGEILMVSNIRTTEEDDTLAYEGRPGRIEIHNSSLDEFGFSCEVSSREVEGSLDMDIVPIRFLN